MLFVLREQEPVFLNMQEWKKKKKTKNQECFFTCGFKPLLPSMWFKKGFLQGHGPSAFPVCVSFFIIDFSSFSLTMEKADALLSIPVFFSFKCSGCVYMEGLVFLFSQLSKPGKLWLCSVVQFTSLCSDLPPRRIWGYGGWYRPGFSSDMQTCS